MNLKIWLKSIPVLCSALLVAAPVQAQWTLDNDASTLSFVTIKADHVGEVHTFDLLSGAIDEAGNVDITIELVSINTLIEIRDERMQNLLFETSVFPEAVISGSIDAARLAAMPAGTVSTMDVEFQLNLHGESNGYTASVLVSRLEDGVAAATTRPVLVNADSFGLVNGVEALREVAGLPGISRAVPVSFAVVFRQI